VSARLRLACKDVATSRLALRRYAVRQSVASRGPRLTVHDDRLHAEVDRQLGEITAACESLATRAGLLITATGVGATIIAARIGNLRPGLAPTLWALGIATVLGILTVSPWLKIGPVATSLQAWKSGGASSRTSSLLYDAKLVLLWANAQRLTVMRTLFALQICSAMAAVVIALWYAAEK
jgi:hypothetical protein